MLVRLTVNPELSGYFIQLTGIDNVALGARGVTLEVSLTDFARFADGAVILAIGVTPKTGGVIPRSLLCFFYISYRFCRLSTRSSTTVGSARVEVSPN